MADWSRVDQLFARAVELPAEARDGFLLDACREDRVLLGEILALVRADEEAATAHFPRRTVSAALRRSLETLARES